MCIDAVDTTDTVLDTKRINKYNELCRKTLFALSVFYLSIEK